MDRVSQSFCRLLLLPRLLPKLHYNLRGLRNWHHHHQATRNCQTVVLCAGASQAALAAVTMLPPQVSPAMVCLRLTNQRALRLDTVCCLHRWCQLCEFCQDSAAAQGARKARPPIRRTASTNAASLFFPSRQAFFCLSRHASILAPVWMPPLPVARWQPARAPARPARARAAVRIGRFSGWCGWCGC